MHTFISLATLAVAKQVSAFRSKKKLKQYKEKPPRQLISIFDPTSAALPPHRSPEYSLPSLPAGRPVPLNPLLHSDPKHTPLHIESSPTLLKTPEMIQKPYHSNNFPKPIPVGTLAKRLMQWEEDSLLHTPAETLLETAGLPRELGGA